MQVHGLDSLLVLAGITFLLGGVACQQERPQQAAEATAVDTAAIRAEIDSVRSGFEEAFNAGGFEAAAEFLHPDMLYSPPGSPPIRGRDSVIAYDRSAFPSGATIEIDPIETRVLSEEWVYDYGISTVSFTPEGADMEQSVESTYLVIVRHTDDGWQVYRESLSSNSPMSGGS
jgi:uncharacterized protein (TIGR02246 family)